MKRDLDNKEKSPEKKWEGHSREKIYLWASNQNDNLSKVCIFCDKGSRPIKGKKKCAGETYSMQWTTCGWKHVEGCVSYKWYQNATWSVTQACILVPIIGHLSGKFEVFTGKPLCLTKHPDRCLLWQWEFHSTKPISIYGCDGQWLSFILICFHWNLSFHLIENTPLPSIFMQFGFQKSRALFIEWFSKTL